MAAMRSLEDAAADHSFASPSVRMATSNRGKKPQVEFVPNQARAGRDTTPASASASASAPTDLRSDGGEMEGAAHPMYQHTRLSAPARFSGLPLANTLSRRLVR